MSTALEQDAHTASQPELGLPATVFSPASADQVEPNQGATDLNLADVEKAAGQDSPASTLNGELDESAFPTGLKLYIIMAALVSCVFGLGRLGRVGSSQGEG